MGRRATLRIDIDSHMIIATQTDIPESEDALEATCTHCKRANNWTPVMDITQHGFFGDDTITIMWCRHCGKYCYVRYVTNDWENE